MRPVRRKTLIWSKAASEWALCVSIAVILGPSEIGDIGVSYGWYDEILRSPSLSVHLPFAASCTNW